MQDRIRSGTLQVAYRSRRDVFEVQQSAIRAFDRDREKDVPFVDGQTALAGCVKSQKDLELFLSTPL